MPHFIELFFKYYGDSFPFLSYEGVVTSFLQSTLSSVLANAIASLASQWVWPLTLSLLLTSLFVVTVKA
jgi:hypothetical protein